MAVHLTAHSQKISELFRLERHIFAAKIRLARAVTGLSQTELGQSVGLTQRAIHKLEQGETEPRRTTVRALEEIWREQNIEFEDLADGGLRVIIRAPALHRPGKSSSRSRRTARKPLGTGHRTRNDTP